MSDAPQTGPSNVIVVLLDSLNRHLLGSYGSDEFETPNLDRFASRAVRFDRHFAGSLPCMPARHDILCGAIDFLWRPWGSVEVWESAITRQLRDVHVTTVLCTDHPHLFETGGENYHTDFEVWEYLRGHEGDPWKTRPDPSWAGAPALPAAEGALFPAQRAARALPHPYDRSRTWFREEADFPGPKTMAAAADWLETSSDAPTAGCCSSTSSTPMSPSTRRRPMPTGTTPTGTNPSSSGRRTRPGPSRRVCSPSARPAT